jgi:hypothetical protein
MALAVLLFSGAAAIADVVSVNASPDPVRINTSGTALVSVRWDVTINSLPAGKVTITSTQGDLVVGGFAVPSPGGVLSRKVTYNGSGPQTYTFRDRIRISRTHAKQIGDGATAEYSRSFIDSSIYPGGDDVQIVPRSGGGVISLRDISIEFDDDTQFRSVAQNASITARAVVSTAGEGRIDASWEVAGPDGVQFRPIARVRQVLAGSRRTVFESPALPTDRAGNYIVRFATQQNFSGTAEIDEIRYVVTPGGAAVPLSLIVPRAGESASAGTPFRWSQVSGAASYRLEFREGGAGGVGNGTRIAAVDLRATEARLKPFTLARIGARTPVFWRVLAFDGNGNVMSTSPARQLGGGARSQSNN